MRRVGECEQVGNHLSAARYHEFGKDPAQVRGHRPYADFEGAGDRLIGTASGYHASDLLLARAERNQSAGVVLDAQAPNVSDNGIKEYALVITGAKHAEAEHSRNFAEYILEPLKFFAAVALTR
jgi:hypothetical protein